MSDDFKNAGSTTVFLLHYLGGSALSWRWVIAELSPGVHIVAIDLPGFGDNAHLKGFAVAEMADSVAKRIHAERSANWILVGHSMGAKVAMAVARRAEDGDDMLAGLRHVITLAGSPPSPEPMDEQQRIKMRGWFADDTEKSREQAKVFISQNTGSQLLGDQQRVAEDDLLRLGRPAWLAWLNQGSLEDISADIGMLQTPTLIVAGSEDENLGVDAQRKLTAPHFAHCEIEVLEGANHLLPLERPGEIAKFIEAAIATNP